MKDEIHAYWSDMMIKLGSGSSLYRFADGSEHEATLVVTGTKYEADAAMPKITDKVYLGVAVKYLRSRSFKSGCLTMDS